MHSLAMAQDILKAALTEAEKHDAKQVKAINVKMGDDHFTESDSLQFCLEAAAKGIIAEGARVEIETFDPAVRCRECGHSFCFRDSEPYCPQCRSKKLKMVDVSEAFLESLDID